VSRSILLAALAALLLLPPGRAAARGKVGNGVSAGVGALFGFGGDLDLDADPPLEHFFLPNNDLEPTLGVGGWCDFGVHPYVSLGGEVRAQWYLTDYGQDEDIDRDFVLDLNASLRAGWEPVASLTLYGRVPLGFSLAFPNDDWHHEGYDFETAAGINFGLLAGVAYDFTERFGALVELGYAHHLLWGEVGQTDVGGSYDVDIDYSMAQAHLQLGFTF
jgi:hypothetical protein